MTFKVYNPSSKESHDCQAIGIPVLNETQKTAFITRLTSADIGAFIYFDGVGLQVWNGSEFVGVGASLPNYTETEQATGQTFLGSQIYQRTFEINIDLQTYESGQPLLGVVPSVDKVVKIECLRVTPNGSETLPVVGIANNENISFAPIYGLETANSGVIQTSPIITPQDYIVTVWYTKS